MPNWESPQVLAKTGLVFTQMMFTFLGVYLWELFTTCDFEWSLIKGRRKFTWPLIFFFLTRYCILWALIGLIITFTLETPINCQALYIFNSLTGNLAILAASTSLMIRTIALWERKRYVMIPLICLALVHWGILWRGMFIIEAAWDPTAQACVVVKLDSKFLQATFFCTMAVDFTILVLTTVALYRFSYSGVRSDLWNLLFRDGLVYWLVTFSFNAVPAVLNVLQLNNAMNVIATVPAATVASIAACRLVIRLQDFRNRDVCIGDDCIAGSSKDGKGRGSRISAPVFRRSPAGVSQIKVTTSHIVMEDMESPTTAVNESFTCTSPIKKKKSTTDLEANYDSKFDYESMISYTAPDKAPTAA
ncbi:hypothetical protein BJ322DRAFT_1113306 [Thelephora terrestris]|uniref:Transmembrane protein n=1 Tax=Thelephora terrestris TaxID=56493 RepID=A0A9P6H705_9AGAM|nr:hypothetical protein BJ322DRAFT_1113306 [Thelephora terrestris]